MFIRLDRVPACDGRTDGQTDGIAVGITALCIACGRAVKIDNSGRFCREMGLAHEYLYTVAQNKPDY